MIMLFNMTTTARYEVRYTYFKYDVSVKLWMQLRDFRL